MYGINTFFRGNRTIKNILVLPKDKDPIQGKVVLYTGTGVTGLTGMRTTLENQVNHLWKDRGNN